MKTIAIVHYSAPPVIGGVEVTIYHHARLLSQSGRTVKVIAGRGERFLPSIEFHSIGEIDSRHPEILKIETELSSGVVSDHFYTMRDLIRRELAAALAGSNIAIVHNAITLHKNLPLTAALHQLAQSGEQPILAWCHDFAWQDELYQPGLHPGYPWDLLRTPWAGVRYVAVSDHRRQRLADLLQIQAAEIQVVPPGVDVEHAFQLDPAIQDLVHTLKLLEAEPLILLPARITRRKNIQFAIQVMAALAPDFPQSRLLVSGPPGPHNPTNLEYLKSLDRLRGTLGLAEMVHFLYEYGQDDQPFLLTDRMMANLYTLADVLLFPSSREGFGIPVLEAGLFRMPIFAASIPPIMETSGEFGILFDPGGDPSEVAAKISAYLWTDPTYQMRRRVINEYTWDRIGQRYLDPLLAYDEDPAG